MFKTRSILKRVGTKLFELECKPCIEYNNIYYIYLPASPDELAFSFFQLLAPRLARIRTWCRRYPPILHAGVATRTPASAQVRSVPSSLRRSSLLLLASSQIGERVVVEVVKGDVGGNSTFFFISEGQIGGGHFGRKLSCGMGNCFSSGESKGGYQPKPGFVLLFFFKKNKSFLCFIIKTIGSVKLFLDCVFVFCSFDKS